MGMINREGIQSERLSPEVKVAPKKTGRELRAEVKANAAATELRELVDSFKNRRVREAARSEIEEKVRDLELRLKARVGMTRSMRIRKGDDLKNLQIRLRAIEEAENLENVNSVSTEAVVEEKPEYESPDQQVEREAGERVVSGGDPSKGAEPEPAVEAIPKSETEVARGDGAERIDREIGSVGREVLRKSAELRKETGILGELEKRNRILSANNPEELFEALDEIGSIINKSGSEGIQTPNGLAHGYSSRRLKLIIKAFLGTGEIPTKTLRDGKEVFGGVVMSQISDGISEKYIPLDFGLRDKVLELYAVRAGIV